MLHRAIIIITFETPRNTCYTSGIISAAKILLITDMAQLHCLLVRFAPIDALLLWVSGEWLI